MAQEGINKARHQDILYLEIRQREGQGSVLQAGDTSPSTLIRNGDYLGSMPLMRILIRDLGHGRQGLRPRDHGAAVGPPGENEEDVGVVRVGGRKIKRNRIHNKYKGNCAEVRLK